MMRFLSCTILVLGLTACANRLRTDATLYERLGGESAMAEIAAATVDTLAASPDGRRTMDRVNLPRLKKKIAQQFCALTAGPCRYTGDDMKLAHAGLKISEREFNAIVEILRDVLNRRGVAEREKNELLQLLAPMQRDIVAAGHGMQGARPCCA
ncbi:MAG: group 1 truncated hemoglobin [Gammaproteobacteria bacterium]|nr:group 1 truncated hemoglobin [Gammaproteobacteria bacterium]